jgi:hypothetical protein
MWFGRRSQVFYYVKSTEKYNELHHAALTSPLGVLRSRLFYHASEPWEGETLELKIALMKATENWETLTGGGAPCLVVFDAENVHETMKLDEVQREADEVQEACQNVLGFGRRAGCLPKTTRRPWHATSR